MLRMLLKLNIGISDSLVKKINLNSLYGAILNPGCRFFDKRIGQSTTLTGRTIVKHMSAEANKVITGTYDHTR